MNGISINEMKFFKQNDYLCHLRQINVFKERYKPGICQSGWYVFGICQKKNQNAVYKSVNMALSIWLVYESHRKVILLQIMVYKVVYEKTDITVLYKKAV